MSNREPQSGVRVTPELAVVIDGRFVTQLSRVAFNAWKAYAKGIKPNPPLPGVGNRWDSSVPHATRRFVAYLRSSEAIDMTAQVRGQFAQVPDDEKQRILKAWLSDPSLKKGAFCRTHGICVKTLTRWIRTLEHS